MRKYLKADIYSNGTLRLRDIAMAQFYALDSIRLSKAERAQVLKAKHHYARLLVASENNHMDFERGGLTTDYDDLDYYVNETLIQILDSHCLPYCYWGCCEGDGASIGVWVNVHAVEDDLRYGEIVYRSDATSSYRGIVVEVSDHGNMTLYNRQSFGHGYKEVEIWSVV